ncbi:MAG: TerC family protein [Pseudomonadota bacterium]|nr:TerC family protein [Pseudomonadota bacterium]
MHEIANPSLAALLQVILIDIVLAGDNAVVIGMAAANVPKHDRAKVVFWGLTAAVILRVILATMTASILEVIGLMFAGGILLLWVCWRLWRDIAEARQIKASGPACPVTFAVPAHASIRRAIVQIVLADLSMSLDNVLAVAGAAMDHVWVLAVGLVLSVALMGLAASLIANLLQRHPWISYAGLIIVFYVAMRMIWFGGQEIMFMH